MPKQSLVEIGLWRNQDKNEKHTLQEVDILRNTTATCKDFRATLSAAPLGDLVAFAIGGRPPEWAKIL